MVGGVLELFENQSKDQVATRVPHTGDLSNPETPVFTTVWNVFRNAFISAFSKNTEGTINFGTDSEEKE
jgi:hypothetical protein